MMASVADKIYASPMAALGSIGVVATMPNIHERLSREGVEVINIYDN
jgi:serine protease SohB